MVIIRNIVCCGFDISKKTCLKVCRFKNIVYFCALFHRSRVYCCCCSSVVEHFLGKEEVVSSSLINSSKERRHRASLFCFIYASKSAYKPICQEYISVLYHKKRVNSYSLSNLYFPLLLRAKQSKYRVNGPIVGSI